MSTLISATSKLLTSSESSWNRHILFSNYFPIGTFPTLWMHWADESYVKMHGLLTEYPHEIPSGVPFLYLSRMYLNAAFDDVWMELSKINKPKAPWRFYWGRKLWVGPQWVQWNKIWKSSLLFDDIQNIAIIQINTI